MGCAIPPWSSQYSSAWERLFVSPLRNLLQGSYFRGMRGRLHHALKLTLPWGFGRSFPEVLKLENCSVFFPEF